MKRIAFALLACTMALAPFAASAQSTMGGGMGGPTDNAMGGALGHAELGTIQSVQGSSLTLTDGRTVFLHDGTVIHPRGTTLAPGMRIAVRGDRSGHRRFNASVVNVSGTRGYRETRRRIMEAHSMYLGGAGY